MYSTLISFTRTLKRKPNVRVAMITNKVAHGSNSRSGIRLAVFLSGIVVGIIYYVVREKKYIHEAKPTVVKFRPKLTNEQLISNIKSGSIKLSEEIIESIFKDHGLYHLVSTDIDVQKKFIEYIERDNFIMTDKYCAYIERILKFNGHSFILESHVVAKKIAVNSPHLILYADRSDIIMTMLECNEQCYSYTKYLLLQIFESPMHEIIERIPIVFLHTIDMIHDPFIEKIINYDVDEIGIIIQKLANINPVNIGYIKHIKRQLLLFHSFD